VESEPTPSLPPLSKFPRLELKKLFQIESWQHEIPWEPFRDGIDIHRLYGDHTEGPAAALLRFREAGKVPAHAHGGYEHILVLAGAQRDQNGRIESGTLMVNPPGSSHEVISEAGCIVLAIYEKAVRFLDPNS
jgi:anti-sigma factor ChrR (cupin superfamily)